MSGAIGGSTLGNEDFAAQCVRCCLRQDLPCGSWVAVAHLGERRPEVVTTGGGLDIRGGHLHLGPLILSCLGLSTLVVRIRCSHFGFEAIAGGLSRVRTLRTEELVDVIGQQIRFGQQRVIRGIVLSSGNDHRMGTVELGLQLLEVLKGLGGLLGLVQEGILHNTGITIQQGRGFSTEMLQDLKAFAADVL